MSFIPFKDKPGINTQSANVSGSASVALSFDNVTKIRLTAVQSGSSDLSSTDHLRQGNEIVDVSQRFGGVQPKMGSEIDSNFINFNILGVPKEFQDDTIYDDIQKISPVSRLTYSSSLIEVAKQTVQEQYDGVLEPLTIRTKTLNDVHEIKADFMDGNVDLNSRSDFIQQFIEKKSPSTIEPFQDSTDSFGNSISGSIKLPGITTSVVKKINPYDETAFDNFLSSSFASSGRTGLANIVLSMSLGVSGAQGNFGIVDHLKKSATAGYQYFSSTELGTDSIAFGDKQSYRSKGFLRDRDCLTGSYPTTLRTGDKDRSGNYKTFFNDTDTIVFDDNVYIDIGKNLHSASIWLSKEKLSQSIDRTSHPRTYPFLGTSKITRCTSASLYATGTVRRGVGDANIRFTPGQEISPFFEDALFDNCDNSAKDSFYITGSDIEDVGIGFSSPLKSKTKVEIDLNPVIPGVFRLKNVNGKNFPMAYWNVKKKKWEGIGTGKTFAFSKVASANRQTFQNGMFGFGVSLGHRNVQDSIALRQAGMPMSNFGFPIHEKFHATSSQLFHLSASIQHPFLVEKIVYEFSSSFAGGAANTAYTKESPINTFFILNQRTGFNITQSFVSVPASSGSAVGALITASMPSKVILSPGAKKIFVNSVRDIVTFSQFSIFNSTIQQDFEVAQRRDLNVTVGSEYICSGTFVMSSSVKSPVATENIDVTQFGTGKAFLIRNDYGSRNGVGIPTGRDLVNGVSGFDKSGSFTAASTFINQSKTNFTINPYLLLPTDTIVFGWQIPYEFDPTLFDHSQLSLNPGKGKLVLYGSLLKGGEEYHDTLNQTLTSPAIHESIGEKVLDQFDTEYLSQFSGSYLDTYVTSSMDNNTKFHRQILGSAFGRNGSHSGSILRGAQLVSTNERFHDTILPRADQITAINGGIIYHLPKETYGAGSRDRGILPLGVSVGYDSSNRTDTDWYKSFPFEGRYGTVDKAINKFNVLLSNFTWDGGGIGVGVFTKVEPVFMSTTIFKNFGSGYNYLTTELDNPVLGRVGEISFVDQYYGIGDYVDGTPKPSDFIFNGSFFFAGAELRGWKYGILNGRQQFTKAIFSRNHYGYIRDMLEQRQDSKIYDTQGTDAIGIESGNPAILGSPVQVKFLGDKPAFTNSSNLSFEATSSLPYFDDVARNREDPINTSLIGATTVIF